MGASFPQLSDCTRAAVVQLHRQYTHSKAVRRSENTRVGGLIIKWAWFAPILIEVKFIYSEKATKFCKNSTLLLFYVVPVKSKVEILKKIVAFSEYMNFKESKNNIFWKSKYFSFKVHIFWEGHKIFEISTLLLTGTT